MSSLLDTRWHKHNLCVFCLGKEHARDVLEGKSACTVSFFLWKSSALVCPSFRGKRGSRLLPAIRDPPLPRHGGELNRGVRSWIFARRPRTRVSCWNVTMRSFWYHQIQRLVLCWVMPSKSRRCLRARKLRLNPLNPPALHMTSYWRLWSI